MKTKKTIQTNSENLTVIQKSKFFAFSYYVDCEEKAQEILKSLSQKYYDATHICYAYNINSKQKCSDDGEPQGTAGKPILDCIQKKKIDNALVVVVRYFGGIKLGAGGLTRAYSNSASDVLAMSGQKEQQECVMIKFIINPSEIKLVELIKKMAGVKSVKTEFGEHITVQIVCTIENKQNLIQNINNVFCREIEILSSKEIFF